MSCLQVGGQEFPTALRKHTHELLQRREGSRSQVKIIPHVLDVLEVGGEGSVVEGVKPLPGGATLHGGWVSAWSGVRTHFNFPYHTPCDPLLGGPTLKTIGPFLFVFSFYLIFAHIHAMVLIYIPTCSPFNTLPNGMIYRPTHAFIYELQVEMYLIVTSFVL